MPKTSRRWHAQAELDGARSELATRPPPPLPKEAEGSASATSALAVIVTMMITPLGAFPSRLSRRIPATTASHLVDLCESCRSPQTEEEAGCASQSTLPQPKAPSISITSCKSISSSSFSSWSSSAATSAASQRLEPVGQFGGEPAVHGFCVGDRPRVALAA